MVSQVEPAAQSLVTAYKQHEWQKAEACQTVVFDCIWKTYIIVKNSIMGGVERGGVTDKKSPPKVHHEVIYYPLRFFKLCQNIEKSQ